jgi:hypothetical protein
MVIVIIHVCNLSMDVQNGNMFYCSVLIILQRELSGILEALVGNQVVSYLV